jgi:hypothetical protein
MTTTLASLVLLLQAVIGLISNPLYQTDPAFHASATTFANQVISLTNDALAGPATTTLQDTVSTTTPPVAPLIPTSSPAVAPTETPVLGAAATTTPPTPAPIVKKQIGWDQGIESFGINGLVSLEAENPKASTTLFEYHATRGLYDSATVTIFRNTDNLSIVGTDYPMTITNIGGGQSSVAQLILDNQAAGLEPGQTYRFSVRIDTLTLYATKTGQITIP